MVREKADGGEGGSRRKSWRVWGFESGALRRSPHGGCAVSWQATALLCLASPSAGTGGQICTCGRRNLGSKTLRRVPNEKSCVSQAAANRLSWNSKGRAQPAALHRPATDSKRTSNDSCFLTSAVGQHHHACDARDYGRFTPSPEKSRRDARSSSRCRMIASVTSRRLLS